MSIERIPLLNLTPTAAPRLDTSNVTALAPPGVAALDELAPYSTALPAAGAAGLAQAEAAGQRVAAGAASAGAAQESGAMQANQLFFSRQLVWQPPDPAAMAASWRVMVKTYGEQRAAQDEQARGQHLPGTLFMAEQNPAVLREGARPPLAMDGEAWRFAVYGWGGQRMMLRVLASDPDEPPGRRRLAPARVALRLELMLADLGRVVIQMTPLDQGMLLDLAAGEMAAQQQLRRMLPQLAEAIGRSGLRVLRCRVHEQLQARHVHNNYPMQASAAALSPPFFRAMAEVALLLSQPLPQAAGESQAKALAQAHLLMLQQPGADAAAVHAAPAPPDDSRQ